MNKDDPLTPQTYYQYIDTVLKEMPVGVALYDAQTLCLLTANPRFHTLLDPSWHGGRAIGQPLTIWLPAAEATGIVNIFRSVAKSGVPYRIGEYAFPAFERGMTYWNWTLDPVHASDGRIVQLVQTVTEITAQVLARRQAEMERTSLRQTNHELEAERKRLEVIEIVEGVARSVRDSLDISSIGEALIQAVIASFDPLVVYLHRADAARRALHLLHIHPSLGERALSVLHHIPYGNATYLSSVHTQREPFIIEDLQVEVAGGRYIDDARLLTSRVHGYICMPLWFGDNFEGVLTAVFKERIPIDGPQVHALVDSSVYVAVALAHARLHAAVKDEQKRLKAILDQLPEGILITEAAAGCVSYANGAAEWILGVPGEKLVGNPISGHPEIQVVASVNSQPLLPWDFAISQALTGETLSSQEAMVIKADGSKVVILSSSAPLRSDQGSITGALLVFQDITLQKSIEQHKTEFLSIASHELRTPITAIQGFAEILSMQAIQEKKLSPQSLRAITFISEQSQQLTHLSEEMLDITRIENAKLQLSIGAHDLVRTIAHVIETQESIAPQHQLLFVLEGLQPGDSLIGEFDEYRIVQVLNNLISNAVKYSRAATKIEVGLRYGPQKAGEALIWVKDSGIGIAAHELPHIFKRFHRASGVDPSISGLGIGLYLVHELVTCHGGRTWAESTEGVGSTFYVQLPLHSKQPVACVI